MARVAYLDFNSRKQGEKRGCQLWNPLLSDQGAKILIGLKILHIGRFDPDLSMSHLPMIAIAPIDTIKEVRTLTEISARSPTCFYKS